MGRIGAHLAVELGGEEDVVAAAPQCTPHHLLRFALRVDVSCVYCGDARVQRGLDDADAFVRSRRRARCSTVSLTEVHGAQGQRADSVPDRPNTRSSLRLISGLLQYVPARFFPCVPSIVTRLHRSAALRQISASGLLFSTSGVTPGGGYDVL